MHHKEGRFAGALGESYWQAWLPDETKAVVVLAHGIAEHTGRYVHVAERLTSHGYAVYAIDHHGHGKSAGTKGNIGRFAGVVEDLHTLRGIATGEHSGLPVFLLGHSMGSLISLDYLVTKGDGGLAGLVLSGAAVDPSVGTKLERMLAPILSTLLPNLALVDLGIDNISRDPAVVERYRTDPLVYTGKVRARTGAEALGTVSSVVAGLPAITLPVLLVHGGSDKLVSPNGSQVVYDGVSSQDKAMKVYDGLFHEIFNEPEQDAVLDDVLTWLDARV